MNHASGTVAPLEPEPVPVDDAIGQRAQIGYSIGDLAGRSGSGLFIRSFNPMN